MNSELVDKVYFDQDFSIYHKIKIQHRMERPHFHDGYEIHYTQSGVTEYYIDEKKYHGGMGTVGIINSHEIHRVVVDKEEEYERYFIYFKPGYLHEFYDQYPELNMLFTSRFVGFENCINLNSDEQIVFKDFLDELYALSQDERIYLRELKSKLLLVRLIIFLNETFMTQTNVKTPVEYKGKEQLEDITKFIRHNYAENITLDLLTETFFLSKSTIIRIFKNNLGITPVQYLINIRIMTSRQLLKSGHSVKEVSEAIGYKDESSFIKKFKSIQGVSPKNYVKQNNR